MWQFIAILLREVTTIPTPTPRHFTGTCTYLGDMTRLTAVEAKLIWTISFNMTNTSTQETYTDFLYNHKNTQNITPVRVNFVKVISHLSINLLAFYH